MDHGLIGPVGDHISKDIRTLNFWMFKLWQMEDDHPLVQSCRLSVAGQAAELPCNFETSPRLFVQLTGRSHVVLFMPEDWSLLCPECFSSASCGQSKVAHGDLNRKQLPQLRRARAHVAELEAGEVLQVPPFWWVHLQTLGVENSFLTVTFFQSGLKRPDLFYGVTQRCVEVRLAFDVESHIVQNLTEVLGRVGSKTAKALCSVDLVMAFMQHLKQQLRMLEQPSLGFRAQAWKSTLAEIPKKVLEDVEVELREMVGSRLMSQDPDIDPEKWLRRMIQGRF